MRSRNGVGNRGWMVHRTDGLAKKVFFSMVAEAITEGNIRKFVPILRMYLKVVGRGKKVLIGNFGNGARFTAFSHFSYFEGRFSVFLSPSLLKRSNKIAIRFMGDLVLSRNAA